MTHAAILELMRSTGQQLVVSGVRVRKWRWHLKDRLCVGVSPTINDDPTAYVGTIAGRTIPGKTVFAMMKARKIEMRRPWFVRTRCRPAE